MSKYELCDVTIKTVTKEGSPNFGKSYMLGTLINTECFFAGKPPMFKEFDQSVIELVKPYVPVSRGGDAEEDKPLPDRMRYMEGRVGEYTPAQPFYKRYLQDNPKLGIKTGDLVSRNGVPVVYTKLMVFYRYFTDSKGVENAIAGQSLEEVGAQAFLNYCVPVTHGNTTSVETPAIEISAEVAQPTAPDGFHYEEVNGRNVLIPNEETPF